MKSPSARHIHQCHGTRLSSAGAREKGLSQGDSSDSANFRKPKASEGPQQSQVEANLKVLARHLVAIFPQVSILSREIGGRYQIFVLVPLAGGPEKAIQVNRAVLTDPMLTEEEIVAYIDRLHLPTILKTSARYDVGPHNWLPVISHKTGAQSSLELLPQATFRFPNAKDAYGQTPYGPLPLRSFARVW